MARSLFAGVLALCLTVVPGFADTLPAVQASLPVLSGPVILTVTGLGPDGHPNGQAEFDLAMLETLGQTKITTSSIWTNGTHVFTGVPLATVIRYLKIDGTSLHLHAINDYAADMPAAEAEADAPILAYEMDGAPMPVRDKGPIWMIYPYDSDARFRTDINFSRSVWQLDRIDVLR